MVLRGKVAVSDQFSVIFHISTVDILPAGPLHLFLVHPVRANHDGEILFLWSQKDVYVSSDVSVVMPQLVSGNNFTTSCTRTSKEGVGGGSSGRREQGEVLLWREK